MDEASFRDSFRGTPLKRTRRRGLVRNAALALANVGGADHQVALERVADDDPDPVVRDAAGWALRQRR
jgi:epoxyqueuosine reductase